VHTTKQTPHAPTADIAVLLLLLLLWADAACYSQSQKPLMSGAVSGFELLGSRGAGGPRQAARFTRRAAP
jgi:hypothetical protein